MVSLSAVNAEAVKPDHRLDWRTVGNEVIPPPRATNPVSGPGLPVTFDAHEAGKGHRLILSRTGANSPGTEGEFKLERTLSYRAYLWCQFPPRPRYGEGEPGFGASAILNIGSGNSEIPILYSIVPRKTPPPVCSDEGRGQLTESKRIDMTADMFVAAKLVPLYPYNVSQAVGICPASGRIVSDSFFDGAETMPGGLARVSEVLDFAC